MHAIVCEKFSQSPVIREWDAPVPGRGEVLVRQAFSSIGAGDRLMAKGWPWVFRPVFHALLHPPILGRDVAGVVEAIGPGVDAVSVGDKVIGEAGQAWAGCVVVSQGALAVVPDGVDLERAAALPVSGATALQGLRAAGVTEGSRLLVVGASGAVGHLAVQIGVHLGARVTAVCSAANRAFVEGLGAERVLDYRTERFTDHEAAWDCVFDLSGRQPVGACLATLRPGGRYVAGAGSNGGDWLGPLPRILSLVAKSLVDSRVGNLVATPDPDDLRTLLDWTAQGAIQPAVHVLDLASAADAVLAPVAAAPGKPVVRLGPAS